MDGCGRSPTQPLPSSRQAVSRKSSVWLRRGWGPSAGHARGRWRERGTAGLAEQRERRRRRAPGRGTLRPAAEDGVRETGAALGAPHQLHQLFSQFGHDGGPANGSLLSGLLPRNMGKGGPETGDRDGGAHAVGR